MTSTSTALKKVFGAGRPLVEQWLDATRSLNGLFMSAWRAGDLDALWDGYRTQFGEDLWLTYYIRARGMGDIKIGKSNHVRQRLLTIFTSQARGVDLVACYPAYKHHEAEIKEEFAHLRLCGEWYRAGPELITHLELIGCDVSAFTNAVPAHFLRRNPEMMS